MSVTSTHDGLLEKRFLRRARLTRWDDLTSSAIPAALADAVGTVLSGPALDGPAMEVGLRFGAWLAGPHGPRRAARILLDAADRLDASDIHVEPLGDRVTIRLRVDGELAPFCALESAVAQRLVAALKGLAGVLPYRSDIVQEGRISRDGIAADVRASFVPVTAGERVALRLFGRLRTIDDLGLDSLAKNELVAALARRTGLILVAGATGAGKTTTLYAALAHVAESRGGAHLSLEDPVEQRLRTAGIAVDQVELAPERGITGESMLAAALRQDIDVLAVGEIRTAAEARLALHAAHSGRLVLAGIHAGSANEAIRRLLDLGVEEPVLRATLAAIVHQSLETRPCVPCDTCRGRGRVRSLVATVRGAEWKSLTRGAA